MTERSPGSRYAERTKRRARRLYTKHRWSKARIARELDVGMSALRHWLAGLDHADHNARRYDRQAILSEIAAGSSRAEVMERHGCSNRWLSDLLSGKLEP